MVYTTIHIAVLPVEETDPFIHVHIYTHQFLSNVLYVKYKYKNQSYQVLKLTVN